MTNLIKILMILNSQLLSQRVNSKIFLEPKQGRDYSVGLVNLVKDVQQKIPEELLKMMVDGKQTDFFGTSRTRTGSSFQEKFFEILAKQSPDVRNKILKILRGLYGKLDENLKEDGPDRLNCVEPVNTFSKECKGAARTRWGFDGRKCVLFLHGGCREGQNNFGSRKQCEDVCSSPVLSTIEYSTMPIVTFTTRTTSTTTHEATTTTKNITTETTTTDEATTTTKKTVETLIAIQEEIGGLNNPNANNGNDCVENATKRWRFNGKKCVKSTEDGCNDLKVFTSGKLCRKTCYSGKWKRRKHWRTKAKGFKSIGQRISAVGGEDWYEAESEEAPPNVDLRSTPVHFAPCSTTMLEEKLHDGRFSANNLFYDDNYPWIPPFSVPDSHFTLNLGCERNLNTVEMRNSHNGRHRNRGTKQFSLYSSSKGARGPWTLFLTGVLPDPRHICPLPLHTFSVDTRAKYLKFQVDSCYGRGGGLRYFNVVTS